VCGAHFDLLEYSEFCANKQGMTKGGKRSVVSFASGLDLLILGSRPPFRGAHLFDEILAVADFLDGWVSGECLSVSGGNLRCLRFVCRAEP
jgi:hypothetical protein